MKDYSKYFRIRDAYNFLISEGYRKQVKCIEGVDCNLNAKRQMVVGLICDKNLVSKFLDVIWIQGGPDHHKDFMDTYNRRYRKRPELHTCF